MQKYDGRERRLLTVSMCKQIAGRAGRFGRANGLGESDAGVVTTLKKNDSKILRKLANQDVPDVPYACLIPTMETIEILAAHLPNDHLGGLLDKFEALARVNYDVFSIGKLDEVKQNAKILRDVDLHMQDRYQFALAPVNHRDEVLSKAYRKVAHAFRHNIPLPLLSLCFDKALGLTSLLHAQAIASYSPIESCDLSKWSLVERVDVSSEIFKYPLFAKVQNSTQLSQLETFHKILMMYLWLRQQFISHNTFSVTTDVQAATILQQCSEAINQGLQFFSREKKSKGSD
jgi:hypothetical protein